MPHITIEYSDNLQNLDESWVLLQVNKALMGLGIFMDADIKTRIHGLRSYRMVWLLQRAVSMLLLQPRSSYSVAVNSLYKSTWGRCCSKCLKEPAFRPTAPKPKSAYMCAKCNPSCISNRSANAVNL